jgi:L-alanine-DL-glutamate epimerase-like enolase superfamily enzyme
LDYAEFLSHCLGTLQRIQAVFGPNPPEGGTTNQNGMTAMKAAPLHMRDVRVSFEDYRYRTAIKFGGVALDRVTLLNVACEIEAASGRRATGFGSMPLGNVWAFPSKNLPYDATLGAMKQLADDVAQLYRSCGAIVHPIDTTMALEEDVFAAAARIPLAEPMPHLAALVVASTFDAALHDAFGKIHGLNCYRTYGSDFMVHDLGHWLGKEFAGLPLAQFVRTEPRPTMPLYHLVGALDPLDADAIAQPVGDGLPETLGDWIKRDGLTHLKIKLNGDNLTWDVERVLGVDRVAMQTRQRVPFSYSLDFNERCPNVAYLLEVLRTIDERQPTAFARIQYIEQPTARDLKSNPNNVMHEAAKIKPVVIDESLLDLQSLMLAREMGYTGVALKACKGQSQSLLLAAAAQKFRMFLCVQDLTCPGASLIHSAGLAAHIPGVQAIEANARQYCPAANIAWETSHPGIFRITNGTMTTGGLVGPGLGAL